MTTRARDHLRPMRAAPFIVLCAVACGGTDTPAPAVRQPTGALCATTSTLTYANFGARFAADYCTSCHATTLTGAARAGAPPGLDLDTLAGIQAAADRIDRVAAAGPDANNGDMPPGRPRPSDGERESLAVWLACGAP